VVEAASQVTLLSSIQGGRKRPNHCDAFFRPRRYEDRLEPYEGGQPLVGILGRVRIHEVEIVGNLGIAAGNLKRERT
jgi:hypothetical protein